MAADPSKEWIEIFDWTKSNGRATTKTVQDIVRNFNAQEFVPPAIIGHKSSYPKDTRIPVGANVVALKSDEECRRLFVQYDYPEKIDVEIPEPYQKLVGMSEFFKEAVNKKLYTSRSIGVGVKKDGSAYLEHVGYLGAQLPEIKGMPAHEFVLLPEVAHAHFIEFASTDDTEFTEFDNTMTKDISNIKWPDRVKPERRKNFLTQLLSPEFAKADPAVASTLMDTLRDLWDVEDATDAELVGIAKKLLSQQDEDEAAAAGAAAALMARQGFYSQFAKPEDLKEFAAGLGEVIGGAVKAALKPMNERLDAFEKKQTEFAAVPAPVVDTVAPVAPAAGTLAPAPESMGLTQDQADAAVEKAKTDLTNSKNWIPAFDSTLLPMMSCLANTKCDTGSCLDQLVTALSAIEGLAEMSELSDVLEYAGIQQRKQEIEAKEPEPVVRTPNHLPTMNGDISKKVTEYMQAHPGTNYVQASDILGY